MTAVDASAPSIGEEPGQRGAGAALRQICAGANAWAETRLDAEDALERAHMSPSYFGVTQRLFIDSAQTRCHAYFSQRGSDEH